MDVYSEWSGPCSAMTNFLKKIKLEVNDDLLSYAMAKSDTIPQLEIFRGQCKPIWLFMATGMNYTDMCLREVFRKSNPKLKINVQNIKLFFQDNLSLFYMAQMLHFYKR